MRPATGNLPIAINAQLPEKRQYLAAESVWRGLHVSLNDTFEVIDLLLVTSVETVSQNGKGTPRRRKFRS